MKFSDYRISDQIKRNLEQLEFRRPTDIQYKAIPSILKGEDVLAIAQTGTGKTAAFVIPVIDMLQIQKTSKRSEGIKAIVMVPTRELALQITEVFDKIAKYTLVKTLCIFGGVDQDPQITRLVKGIDILVATPGRLFDLVSQGYVKLEKIQFLILDEADHMLDLGFIKDIQDLIRFLPKKRQTLFFSATISPTIKKLAYSLVSNPIRIQISPKNPVAKNVRHAVAFVEMDDKRYFLERLINENSEHKILVFVRTKVRAERVAKAMARVNIEAKTIHGDKEQKDRLAVMNAFKKDAFKVLIATDVSARGIDIPNVQYVVNYDLPDKAENYVHRIGRTGRGNKRGDAVSFCSENEKALLQEIEDFIQMPIEKMTLNKNEYLDVIDTSNETQSDWKTLMKEMEEENSKKKKRKKKK